MDSMGISTEPTFLDVELPQTLIESPSVSTFLPDEEASVCPLLSSSSIIPSHPLSTNCVSNDITSSNISNTDCKAETSSSGSSTGIAMDGPDSASTNLFNKVNYHHLQNNNINNDQDSNGHCLKANLNHSKETPSFVSWNWPLIRKCTFFVFISVLLAMCSIVVAKIVSLPKSCNPKTAWYRGSVFYEIFPASFQDSDNDGTGDIAGIQSRSAYLTALGVSAIRLNSIFLSDNYPDNYDNVTSISKVSPVLGTVKDIQNLAETLHEHNMTLLLDLPLQQYIKDGKIIDDKISGAIKQWIGLGVDGFYIKGLENHTFTSDLVKHLALWKRIIGQTRILMVGDGILINKTKSEILEILKNLDLVDVRLPIHAGADVLYKRIQYVLNDLLPPSEDGTWVHWSLGGVDSSKRISQGLTSSEAALATTIMQLMLPGTPSIFYGDEIGIEDAANGNTKLFPHLMPMVWPNATHHHMNPETSAMLATQWKPNHNYEYLKIIINMIALRERSPSIYKNVICKPNSKLSNTQVRLLSNSKSDILLLERSYPRRNSFVSITNLSPNQVMLDLSSKFYSGNQMLIDQNDKKVYFKLFETGPFETIVVKLDK